MLTISPHTRTPALSIPHARCRHRAASPPSTCTHSNEHTCRHTIMPFSCDCTHLSMHTSALTHTHTKRAHVLSLGDRGCERMIMLAPMRISALECNNRMRSITFFTLCVHTHALVHMRTHSVRLHSEETPNTFREGKENKRKEDCAVQWTHFSTLSA
jgi:hypothetical protein